MREPLSCRGRRFPLPRLSAPLPALWAPWRPQRATQGPHKGPTWTLSKAQIIFSLTLLGIIVHIAGNYEMADFPLVSFCVHFKYKVQCLRHHADRMGNYMVALWRWESHTLSTSVLSDQRWIGKLLNIHKTVMITWKSHIKGQGRAIKTAVISF